MAEAVLPETDDDAVRIMTIHAAKGLEFPITILSGVSTEPRRFPVPAEVVFLPDSQVGYHFGAKIKTQAWDAWKPIDEQMAYDERIRLLYVACTRAKDHLVVSLHRKDHTVAEPAKRTNAEILVAGMAALLDDLPDAAVVPSSRPHVVATVATATAAEPVPFDIWQATLQAASAVARRPVAVAATALREDGVPDGDDRSPTDVVDAGLQKRPRDLDLPPWLTGRYGTSVGRAVHGVLQVIDLATGAGLDDAVAAQCEAEAIPLRAADVARLVRAALRSPSVKQAATSEHRRELYAATPLDDGRLLEGSIDLLYRGSDGLVVVDYKTSSSADATFLDQRVEGYRSQGNAYRTMISAVTGEVVAGVVFVFLTQDGAIERWLL